MKDSKIGWTSHTWNPVTGCTKVSPGCENCYAEVIAERFRGASGWPVGFDLQLRPDRIRQPLTWKKPARIFVNSMSDLFHRDIPDDYLRQIWDTMVEADWHQFQVLTKRAHVMRHRIGKLRLPTPPHIWLGVSAENQEMADSRIPELLKVHMEGVRFISAEPLLGPISLIHYLPDIFEGTTYKDGEGVVRYDLGNAPVNRIDWVIIGGESGQKRRPMDYNWARSIIRQCKATDVPVFLKQGNHLHAGNDRVLDGRTYDEFPDVEVPHPDVQGMLV